MLKYECVLHVVLYSYQIMYYKLISLNFPSYFLTRILLNILSLRIDFFSLKSCVRISVIKFKTVYGLGQQ